MEKGSDKLSESRKADREKMANILIAAMVEAGAVTEIMPADEVGPRELWVKIEAPGGAYIVVDFDGDSCQPNVHVATWNLRFDGKTFFNPVIGDVNPFHYGKATRVCHGLESLIETLKRDVASFADGSGYMKPDDYRIKAMRQSYRERGWIWPGEKT